MTHTRGTPMNQEIKHVGLTERDIARGALLLAGTDFAITLGFAWIGAETHIEPWNPVIVVPAFTAAWILFKFSGDITVFFAKTFRLLFGERKATYSYSTTMKIFENHMNKLFAFAERHHVKLVSAVETHSNTALSTVFSASSLLAKVGRFTLGVLINLAYLLAYVATVPALFLVEAYKYSHETLSEHYSMQKAHNQVFRYNKTFRFNRR